MLWYKSWLDTRWRFLIGLGVLLVAACAVVFSYPALQQLLPDLESRADFASSDIGRAIQRDLATLRTYDGYVWYQWFEENFALLATIFAASLGSGSALSRGRGAAFSLALPVTRSRWVAARAVTGLAELLALAVLPSLAIVVLSPLLGQRFPVGDALLYALCGFVVASVFFALASLLSTVFDDVWRPLLLTCLLALGIGFGEERVLPNHDGPFDVMSAAAYFYTGSLPWLGLLVSAALTAALLYAAAASIERRDF